jgi:hypothetical protein
MQGDWDTALVRHIYDVHCINARLPALVADSCKAFETMVQGDVAEFGKQQDDFSKDPFGVMKSALDQAKTNRRTRDEYEQNLLPLVYGGFKPHFDEAFTAFEHVARTLLDSAAA